tara:strand:+ start:607 stop:999 length:393 start_codon:yes stop_codon:yes gene_type:complete
MSHFSTVKTQLRKLEPLLQALHDLGYQPQEGEALIQGYKGQTVMAEVAVPVNKGGDFGFRLNPNTQVYELVTDLDLWKQDVPVERFISMLTQRYALNTVLTATGKEGFEVAEQNNNKDGSIELVLTRWDP